MKRPVPVQTNPREPLVLGDVDLLQTYLAQERLSNTCCYLNSLRVSFSSLLLEECWTWQLSVMFLRNIIYSLQNILVLMFLGLMPGSVRSEISSCYKVRRSSSDNSDWSSWSVWPDLEQLNSPPGLHLRPGLRGVSTSLPGSKDDLHDLSSVTSMRWSKLLKLFSVFK